jgi:hypothetical protein
MRMAMAVAGEEAGAGGEKAEEGGEGGGELATVLHSAATNLSLLSV